MKGQAYINGNDIWLSYSAALVKGAYEALLTPAPMKDYISSSNRMKDGVSYVVDTTSRKTDKRSVSFSIFIQGSSINDYLSKYSALMSELTKGVILLKVTTLKTIYKLVYIESSKYGDYGVKAGKFTFKFDEPNISERETI